MVIWYTVITSEAVGTVKTKNDEENISLKIHLSLSFFTVSKDKLISNTICERQ